MGRPFGLVSGLAETAAEGAAASADCNGLPRLGSLDFKSARAAGGGAPALSIERDGATLLVGRCDRFRGGRWLLVQTWWG